MERSSLFVYSAQPASSLALRKKKGSLSALAIHTSQEPPPIPEVTDPRWQRSPIDAFIHARMAAASLQPSPSLSKRALLRRLAFDLTGLPPTPAEMKRFPSEGTPDSYAQAVDYYLASPRYGEHCPEPKQ